jgi:toxin FitB
VSYLLDTNIVSEARKPHGNRSVKKWLAGIEPEDLFLSVLVVGEIRQGIAMLQRRDPMQAAVYEAWLQTLQSDYSDRLLPITGEIAQEWGRLNVPNPVPVIDGLMAATAKIHGHTLVTRNTSDLMRTGVKLLDPFSR